MNSDDLPGAAPSGKKPPSKAPSKLGPARKRRDVRPFFTQRVQLKTVAVRFRLRAVQPVTPVRKYIITVTADAASVAAAERCIESAKRFGEDANLEIFPGVNKHQSRDFFARHGLTLKDKHPYRRTDLRASAGCFASHYSLWLRCVESGEPIIVLEHDAVFRAPIPPLRFRHVVALCTNSSFIGPSALRFFDAVRRFKGKEVFHIFRMMPGTCCYAIKPEGARRLIDAAAREEIFSTDHFITVEKADIVYYYPSPVESDRRFSMLAPTGSGPGPGHEAESEIKPGVKSGAARV